MGCGAGARHGTRPGGGLVIPGHAADCRRGIRANLGQFVQQAVQVFFVGLLISTERTVLPALSGEFGVASGSFFFLLSFVLSFGLVKGALNFVAGSLSDRIGRKPVLLLGWIAGLPIPVLIYLAPNWWWVIAANVLLGVNQGFAWTMTVTSKVDITGSRQRGLAVGINECAGYVAVGLGGVAVGYLAAAYGPRPALLGLGLAVAVVGLATAAVFVRETLPWARAEEREQREVGGSGPASGVPAGLPEDPSAREIFALVSFRHRTFRALAQAGVSNKVADTLVWVLFPRFLAGHGVPLVTIGWVTGAYAMTWGAAQLWTGHLSDRIGRKLPIVGGLWLLALGIAGSALSRGVGAWLAWAVAMGLGMALLYPNIIAAVADISAPAWRGKSLGAYRYWRDTGYAIGAIVLGAVAQRSHALLPAFWTTAALLIASGLWVSLGAEETLPGLRRNES